MERRSEMHLRSRHSNPRQQETAEQNSSVTLDAPQKDSVVTGSVHAEADGYALFMIPYEKGWSLTIDGERAELLRGDIGFLACEVPEGDHTILLTFEAPGLKAGTIGSVLFWILVCTEQAPDHTKE